MLKNYLPVAISSYASLVGAELGISELATTCMFRGRIWDSAAFPALIRTHLIQIFITHESDTWGNWAIFRTGRACRMRSVS
jgi:hypothetical protein